MRENGTGWILKPPNNPCFRQCYLKSVLYGMTCNIGLKIELEPEKYGLATTLPIVDVISLKEMEVIVCV